MEEGRDEDHCSTARERETREGSQYSNEKKRVKKKEKTETKHAAKTHLVQPPTTPSSLLLQLTHKFSTKSPNLILLNNPLASNSL